MTKRKVSLTQPEVITSNTLPILKTSQGFDLQITQQHIDKVTELCSLGAKAEYIAHSLGISLRGLELLRLDCPEMDSAINSGNAIDEFEISSSLRNQAMQGNVLACIYYTKARHGWREKDSATNNNLTVIQVNTGINRLD